MEKFRDALIYRLEKTKLSLRKVAQGSGVSYEQLKKLKQVEDRTTNVEDAIKVAAFFGLTVEQFMMGEEGSSRNDLVRTLTQLSPEGLELLENVANAQLAAERNPRQE